MEAIDALYGSNALTSQLQAFLNQCDLKVQALLANYRQANIAARKKEPPAHFNDAYHFPPFEPTPQSMSSPEIYERDRQQISDAIDKAIKGISQEYRQALEAFPAIAELEGEPSGAARKAERAANRPSDHRSAPFSGERPPPAEADVTALHDGLSVVPGGKAVSR